MIVECYNEHVSAAVPASTNFQVFARRNEMCQDVGGGSLSVSGSVD